MISEWEKHTLLADTAMQLDNPSQSILHYQQALTLSEQILDSNDIEIDERLTIAVISCHNLAQFWRWAGDSDYELKYLQLASERVLTLIPQCPHRSCASFVEPIGCCKKALVDFMKRHPNPMIAKHVQDIDTATSCEIIAKFRLN
ncbi:MULTISPECIES: DUF2753 domain-containing protein [unclassified Vibrio]|uniref:DUF2753 domain-containing protein n=1 Tax=Vibrio sp. HB236076 TaxID=3232307 RepID=A0AB39HCA4_9VIBR|nr:DUF2753 domain-containing protein [Vibrio sp. HB161653]MDP5253746.1 DUF2753 domain-containing protein [Vibrio sp. HB161653]